MTAAIYARKSTDQSAVADDQKSVARQVERARAYADQQGWQVLDEHVYVDDGISGAEFANRPGFLRLMNALRPRAPFGVLVMSEGSRLGRESIETAYALKNLMTAGVRVFSYLDGRERTLEGPTDKLLMSVAAFADELERDRARQRTYDAMSRKAQAGHVTGGRVFGYDNLRLDGHVERRINESEAAVVRRIFELAAAGLGQRRIALQLNEDAVPAPRAQRGRPSAWSPSSIHEVLRRPLYRGEIVWNQTRKRDAWGRHRQAPRESSEWMRVPAPELQIVPDELWNSVQARIASRKDAFGGGTRIGGRPIAGTVSPYLLTGFCACGCCKGTLTVRTRPHGRRRVPRMACFHYMTRGPRACGNRWEAPLDALEALVLDTIKSELLDPRVVDEAIRLALDTLTADDGDGGRRNLEQQITDLDAELERLTDLAASGAGSIPSILSALKDREARRTALVARVATIPARTARRDRDQLETAVRVRVADWRALLQRNVAEARPIVELLLAERISVTPAIDRGDVTGYDVLIPLTSGAILAGIDCPKGMASPTGFEPVF